MDDCILTAENVVKSFGKFRALDGASLRIPKGCIFGIIGPNGAGKSTLLRIVTSLAHPDSGRVTVNGRVAKASVEVKAGDIIEIGFGNKEVKVEVLSVAETVRKDDAKELFRYL